MYGCFEKWGAGVGTFIFLYISKHGRCLAHQRLYGVCGSMIEGTTSVVWKLLEGQKPGFAATTSL